MFVRSLVIFLFTFVELAAIWAEEYPSRPIQVIVPTSPGGTFDKIARLIQRDIERNDRLSKKLFIQNLPGAGGTFGTTRIKDASPDGYTIGLWGPGLVTSKRMGNVSYDHTAFEIIGATGFVEIGLGVQENSRHQTIEALIESLQYNPKSVKVATNMGLPVHFFPLLFAEAADVDFRFVQVGGGSKRLASILGGHTDVSQFSILEFESYRNSDPKKVGIKPIVMFSAERSPQFPEIPTAKELGYDLVLVESVFWLAPKGLPVQILELLRSVLRQSMLNPELQIEFEAMGIKAEFIEASEALIFLDDIGQQCEVIPAGKLEVLDMVPIDFSSILFVATAICIVALIFKSNTRKKAKLSHSYKREPYRAIAFLIIACVYIALLPHLGFRWSTLGCIGLSGFALNGFTLNRSDAIGIGIMSLSLGFGVFYLFGKVFAISLP